MSIPCLHLCSLRALPGIFYRPFLLVHGTEVFEVVLSSVSLVAMAWKTIVGALSRISAGSATNVWGVNAAGTVFRYTGDDGNPWVGIPGVVLTDIGAAADGTVWGVDANADGQIFRYTGNKGDPNHWVNIKGSLTRISVGSVSNVWGVNAVGNIFRYTGFDSNPWASVPGTLSDIGAGADGTVWGVNSSGQIYRYTGDQGDPNHWVNIPGATLSAISAGVRTNVWGVNASNAEAVYTYLNDDKNPWLKIDGSLADIGTGADGVVWGVDTASAIYRWDRR